MGNTLCRQGDVVPAQNRRTGIAVMDSTDARRASASVLSAYTPIEIPGNLTLSVAMRGRRTKLCAGAERSVT